MNGTEKFILGEPWQVDIFVYILLLLWRYSPMSSLGFLYPDPPLSLSAVSYTHLLKRAY